MNKTSLIDKNIQEKPTGTEVIKRLLKNEWIAEKNNENDKRSKLIFLTEKGKGILFQTFGQIGKASEIITGSLEQQEKLQLLALLKKLQIFHQPLFITQKNKNWEEFLKLLENK
jgi:DNA-binding MarR family transcriptional regulator